MDGGTRWSGVAPAVALFLLAPLIAEFLLGDFPITMLPLALVLAPLYGGGALLVREVALRFGAGWPGVFVLGLAFGIIEESFATQSLFNPNYLGLHLLAYGWVAPLGIGLPWTVFVLGLHMIWSVATSIGLTEALFPRRAGQRWLGQVGLVLVGLIFAGGCILLFRFQRQHDPFLATRAQFAGAAALLFALIALARMLRRAKPLPRRAGPPPPALAVAVLALLAGSLFLIDSRLDSAMPAWANVAVALGLAVGAAVLVRRWSAAPGWTARHRLALVAGAVLTYAWWGFFQPCVVPTPLAIDLVSNAIFAAGAVALLVLAYRRRGELFDPGA